MALYLWAWLETALASARELAEREEGQDGMEYAVVAAIVIVAVAAALTVGKDTINTIIQTALNRIESQIPT